MEGVHGVTGVVRDAYLWAMRTPLILLPLLVPGPLRAAAQPVVDRIGYASVTTDRTP